MADRSSKKIASPEMQAAILGNLQGRRPRSIVSSRRLIAKVRGEGDCLLSDEEIAGLIREAALLLGLVPVYVREPQGSEINEAVSFERLSSAPVAGGRGYAVPPRH